MATKYKYAGAGMLPGVPARDLTDEDLAELAPEARLALEEHMKLGTDAELEPDERAACEAARIYKTVEAAPPRRTPSEEA